MLPRYEWAVDYIDAMCFSNTYQPIIPTALKVELKDLSIKAQEAIFKTCQKREELLTSPFISPAAKAFHSLIFWNLDHDAAHYCK